MKDVTRARLREAIRAAISDAAEDRGIDPSEVLDRVGYATGQLVGMLVRVIDEPMVTDNLREYIEGTFRCDLAEAFEGKPRLS